MGKVNIFRKKQPLSRRDELAKRRLVQQQSQPLGSGPYQRNQTISHNHVTSEEASVRDEVKKTLRRRRLVGLWSAGLVLVIVFAGLSMWQFTMRVSIVASANLSDDNKQSYAQILNQYFADRPIERLRFLTDYGVLNQYFQDKAPEVASVSLVNADKPFESTLNMAFRQPVAQWLSAEGVYYVDAQGVTFETNYFTSPDISINDLSGVPAYQGQSDANKRFLEFLGRAVSQFAEADLAVSEASLPPDTARQIELKFTNRETIVRMTVDRSASAQVGEAIHAINYFDSVGRVPEYIDVRVDQRVFYK